MKFQGREQKIVLRELLEEFESGSRPKGGVKGILEGVPSLGGEHLNRNGGFNFEKIKFVPRAFAESMTRGRVKAGDILVVKDGATTGKVSLVRSDFPYSEAVINEHVFRLRLNEQNDPAFAFYFLHSETGQQQILSDFRGAAQGGISQKFVEKVYVPAASLGQQRFVVAEIEKQFTRLDAGVATLRRVQANLKRYRAAVLKAACEGRLVPTEAELAKAEGRTYETGEQLLTGIIAERRKNWHGRGKYKEPTAPDTTNLPRLPEGWTWASVEQISAKVVDGVHKKPEYVPSGIPFVTVRNLTAGNGISFEKLSYVTPDDHAQFIKRADPERGDILISKDGTLGVVRVVATDVIFSIFVSVALVKPIYRAMTKFLGIAFSSPQVQSQMVPKGSGLQHIHLEDLRADCLPLAPLIEQARIVAEGERRLSIIEELEATVTVNLQRAARLRQSILQRAFTTRR